MRINLKIFLFLLHFLIPVLSVSQRLPDSLRQVFATSLNDSVLYESANHIYDYYEEQNRDSAFFYANQCVIISARNNKKLNQAYSLSRKAYQQVNLGRFADALHSLIEAFSISEDPANDKFYWAIDPLKNEIHKRLYALSCTHHIYAILMRETLNREQQIIHFKEAKRIADQINNPARSLLASLNLGRIYLEYNKPDSALLFENEALTISRNSGRQKYLSTILYYSGIAYMNLGDTATSLNNFYQCIESAKAQANIDGLTRGYHRLADYYIHKKNADSSIYYALKSLETMRRLGAISQIEYNIGDAYVSVYESYRLKNQMDSAYQYLILAHTASDSISYNRIKNLADFQKLTLNEQKRLQNLEKDRVVYQSRIRTYFLLLGIGVLLLLATIFYRNNRQKHKANIKLEQAYDHLKTTQQQLIQSEKMASLGELTAGIAHEIQNPLNFVNNFSEVNAELLGELKEELAIGNTQQAIELADDIKENELKIMHHGKRAESIVKGMLQHSRKSTGTKELADINALADEYMRLSYHGLGAKDKTFNAEFKMDLDPTLPLVKVIPQDIGRVLLNLFNNAFWAVNEKSKLWANVASDIKSQSEKELEFDSPSGGGGGVASKEYSVLPPTPKGEIHTAKYIPLVALTTKNLTNHIEIIIHDNGSGIPPNIIDKIFQPFFTTKPTGQGTGLGLSLAYDIIKAHGGTLNVISNYCPPGGDVIDIDSIKEGSTFKILLPIQ